MDNSVGQISLNYGDIGLYFLTKTDAVNSLPYFIRSSE